MLIPGAEYNPVRRTFSRYDFVFDGDRFPLKIDALFRCRGTPIVVFVDAMDGPEPSDAELSDWHRLSWNFGVAPLLWVATKSRVLLLNSYEAPHGRLPDVTLVEINLNGPGVGVEKVTAVCGRLAFDTGAFWRSQYARRVDRKHRVDAVLLRELAALENALRLKGLDVLIAQKLIGRAIFSQYLVDRKLLRPTRLLELFGANTLPAILRDALAASRLFAWLKVTFNGDLFPPDALGEEDKIGPDHLSILADFLTGYEISSRQWRLFPFRFDIIPVELISSIYEQFAHSIAGDDATAQGLHYTPTNLVDLMLDTMFDDVAADARVLDPACGSGVFLVEAFRRLVWRRSQQAPCSRAEVREILYNQIFGIDINPGALQVTAFSLYLAALELDPSLSDDLEWLKFDHLIGRTLHSGSFFDPEAFLGQQFDAIIGNPPWTYAGRRWEKELGRVDLSTAVQPRRTPDWAFVWRARDFARTGSRVSFLMKATPFFSKDRAACAARRVMLSSFRDVQLINMAQLRGENLFPTVISYDRAKYAINKRTTGPALLFSGRLGTAGEQDKITLVNVPWLQNFKRQGVFEIAPEMYKKYCRASIESNPALFKAAMQGNAREFAVMEGLQSAPQFVRLGAWCGLHGVPMEQGLQLCGGGRSDSSEMIGLDYVEAANYRPLRAGPLPRFTAHYAHRPRSRSIYNGPLVLCPESGFAKALERGRYSAAVCMNDTVYSDSFVGVSFAERDHRLACLLNAILNSKMTAFQLAFGGSNIGLKQPKVEKIDLEELIIPDLFAVDADMCDKILRVEAQLSIQAGRRTGLQQLDELIQDLYALPSPDRRVIDDVLARSRPLFMDARQEQLETVRSVELQQFMEYGHEITHWLDTVLSETGPYRTLINRVVRLSPDVVALRIDLESGPARALGPFAARTPELFESKLIELLGGDTLPRFHEVRFMRIYADRSLYVVKPDERRYWRISDAQADVDLILHDQKFRLAAALDRAQW
jgi:hypothetical protein